MREFKYVAITQRGKSSSGVISAKNTKEAKEKLVKDGLRPLKISSAGKHKKSSSKSASNDSSGEKQKSVSIAKGSQKGERLGLEFLKRLHELHGSGMPIAESVKLLNLRSVSYTHLTLPTSDLV